MDKQYPKVAILILNWNGWKDTIECLESVFRISYPNYQVIVIDNGSTDGSMEKIKAWVEGKQEVLTPYPTHPLYHLSHPPVKKPIPYIEYSRKEAEAGGNPELENSLMLDLLKDERQFQSNTSTLTNATNSITPTTKYPLILIQTGANLGFAGGNNVGIRYVLKKRFEYIWLLNNDTVIDKNSLKYLVELIENNKNIGAVGSKILYYNNPKIIQALGGGRIIPWLGLANHIGKGYREDRWKDNEIFLDYIMGASLLVKKEIIKNVGLIDEIYFLYWEDTDWCERIKRKGWNLGYSSKSKVYHKGSSSIDSKNCLADYFYTKNALIFFSRFYKYYIWITFPIIFLGKISNRIRRKKFKNLISILKAYKDWFIND